MADGGVTTEVNKEVIPKAPREIKRVDPQRHALEKIAASQARERAALIASGEDHVREEAEKIRKELEAEAQANAAPSFDQTPITVHNVKIHPHPGEIPYDIQTGTPVLSSVVVEKEQKPQPVDVEKEAG